jgi:hypothetical protein
MDTRIIKLRRMRWAEHVARMRENKNAYRLLVGMPERMRPLGRPRGRWMDNIKMDRGGVDWIGVKNGVFWEVMPSGSCKNRRFGRT